MINFASNNEMEHQVGLYGYGVRISGLTMDGKRFTT